MQPRLVVRLPPDSGPPLVSGSCLGLLPPTGRGPPGPPGLPCLRASLPSPHRRAPPPSPPLIQVPHFYCMQSELLDPRSDLRGRELGIDSYVACLP
uniref:Splicing factor 3A subunit 2-like isoform X1 n=1 Tax=Phascolarctos cinereus TaxID=38626 RepID=A0A6P5LL04_PHACI|nr:splicing factor 3A subunit 2-like isoform X1 [Phascolarctos cinereus]